MSFTFTPAVRANVPLLLGFSGGTGSGKTMTAMRVATGLCGDKPFAVIDTESGRAKHYADMFRFDHAELRAPFRPEAYLEAILAADAAGYPAVVVDSMSHVWAGEGGVLDWQEEELDRMAGTDWQKREGCKMAAWIKPKTSHKKMVQRLLQVRCHVILCFRAEQKIEMVREPDDRTGKMKTKIVAKESLTGLHGWIPICEKGLPFELTASFLLTADAPGIIKPIKLQEQHKPFFPLSSPTTEDTGKRLAEWSKGIKAAQPTANSPTMSAGELAELVDCAMQIGPQKAKEGMAALLAWGATLKAPVKLKLQKEIAAWKAEAENAGK